MTISSSKRALICHWTGPQCGRGRPGVELQRLVECKGIRAPKNNREPINKRQLICSRMRGYYVGGDPVVGNPTLIYLQLLT